MNKKDTIYGQPVSPAVSARETCREKLLPSSLVRRSYLGERQARLRRIFAISDIHVDHKENASWIQTLSSVDYVNDVLILGGDVSSDIRLLQETLRCLKSKFAEVFFVPGNHELWVRAREGMDSMAKFFQILKLCASMAVHTGPEKVDMGNGKGVWIVPLFSWYRKPEEGSQSLFLTKESEDLDLDIWADDHFTKWDTLIVADTIASTFLRMNESRLQRHYDAPVISFSHFLPRRELMFCPPTQRDGEKGKRVIQDSNPGFNFSRVAGCADLEEQIRRLGSVVHVYGHQHRNRDRQFEGVRYVSHCLGYPQERKSGLVCDIEQGPLLILPD